MGKRVVWLLAACTGLVLFLRGDGLAYMAAAPRAVGIGGWGLVGMGFLTVARTALRGPGAFSPAPSRPGGGRGRGNRVPACTLTGPPPCSGWFPGGRAPAAENFFKKPSKITIYGGFCAKL